MYVIVFTPEPMREYGAPEAVGPFESAEEAQDHLDANLDTQDGWIATVVRVEHPSEER